MSVSHEKEKEKFLAWLCNHKRATNLVELIGVMIVIIIIAGIAIGGIIAARDKANITSAQSDIRTFQTAIQQVVMSHPEIMKYSDSKPANSVQNIVALVNDALEEDWQFEVLSGVTGSGAVAGSTVKRDPWNNAYGLYIYTDDCTETYTDETGTPLLPSDSCITIAVVSAGKNSTGGPVGVDGNNYDATTRKISSATAMVNNTDGSDDIGVIIRVLNGDTRLATFGFEQADLGTLEDVQWIYGVPTTNGGICADFSSGAVTKSPTMGGSLNQYFDQNSVASVPPVAGTW